MQEMRDETKAVTRAEILELRKEQRRTSLLPDEPDFASNIHTSGPEYGMKLVKELIRDLCGLAESGQIHTALANKTPVPMFKMALATKRAKITLSSGKPYTYNVLPLPKYNLETHMPRMIREGRKPTTIRLLKQKNQSSLYYTLIYSGEECDNDPAASLMYAETDSILSTERFRWVGAGRDKFSIQPWPDLLGLEKGLEKLIEKPLKDIFNIPEVAHEGSRLIRLVHHTDKLGELLVKTRNLLETSLYAPLAMLGIMRQYEYLAAENQAEQFSNLINCHIDDYAGLGLEMKTIQQDLHAIQTRYPDSLNFGLVELDLRLVKQELLHNGKQLLRHLLHELVFEYSGLLNYGFEVFAKLCQDLKRVPTTVEELKDLSDYIENQEDLKKFETVKAMVQKTVKIQQILTDFQQSLDPEEMIRCWHTALWESELMKTRHRMITKLGKVKPMFVEQVVTDAKKLKEMVGENRQEIDKFERYENTKEAVMYAALADEVLQVLRQAAADIAVLNSREKVLGLELTNLGDFAAEIAAFRKHSQLWTFARGWVAAWSEWHNKSFRIINPESVELKFREGVELLQTLEAEFQGVEGPLSVVTRLRKQVHDFGVYVQVISQLRHVSIRDRHWELILKELSLPQKPEAVTLNELVQCDILAHRKTIDEVYHRALNEYAVEVVLDRTEDELNTFSLELKKDPTYPDLVYLSGLEESENSTHCHLATLRFLSTSSRFVTLFKQRIDKAVVALAFNLQLLKDIRELQEKWCPLYPILQLPEIADTISRDTDLIEHLSTFYTKQLTFIYSMQMLTVATDLKIRTFVEAIESADTLRRKALKVYEECVGKVPRLQILSEKEVVALLQAISNQQKIPFGLLFPGISPLSLSIPEISTVFHGDHKLTLASPIQLLIGSRRVPTETWIPQLENGLKAVFKSELLRLLAEAEDDPKDWWKATTDPQLLILTQSILFSKTTRKPGIDNLETVCEELCLRLRETLSSVIMEIKPNFGNTGQVAGMYKRNTDTESKTSKRQRLEKFALQLLTQIHFLSHVLTTKSFNQDDFLWQSLFSFDLRPTSKSFEIHVQYFHTIRPFGFEWLPLPLPLFVPTPISDRCFLNLSVALKRYSSAVLCGESGTAKTETLRELSIMHSRLMLMWTAGNTVNPQLALRALVACAAAGTWMCLQEIHRFETYFLNSLSFYITKIGESAAAGGGIITVEDTFVKVHPGFAFWGVSTLQEVKLPLRAQETFRCLAVIRPDLAAVAELRLAALGVKQARALAQKIAKTLFSISADAASITSSQHSPLHSINSVRTVHELVSRIALMLDSYPVTDERYLVSNALRRVVGSTLPHAEEVLFDEFLSTVFRSSHNNVLAGTALQRVMEELMEVLEKNNVETTGEVMKSVRYLWVSVADSPRKVILLTGPPGSGKTTILRAVATAYSEITSAKFSVPVLSTLTSERCLRRLIQACAKGEMPGYYKFLGDLRRERLSPSDWICVDTNTLAPDVFISIARSEIPLQKNLCSTIPPALKFILETDNLNSASPHLIAESCIVHCAENGVKESQIFRRALEERLSGSIGQLVDLFDSHFKPLFKSAVASQPLYQLSVRLVVLAVVRWLYLLLSPMPAQKQRSGFLALETDELEGHERPALLDSSETSMMEVAWVISLIAAVGSLLRDPEPFESAVMNMCETEPEEFACGLMAYIQEARPRSMNDVAFDFTTRRWTTWELFRYAEDEQSVLPKLPESMTVFVPCNSTARLKGWIGLVTDRKVDIAVLGPHQSGKSLVLSQVLRSRQETHFTSIIPLHVLLSTTSESVQYTIEAHMDELQSYSYGALGGRHHYVFLEDMNMDSHGIYDCLRFLREHGGWYHWDKFTTIEDVSLCVAHSYSLHRFRALDIRSLRHFIVLYHDQYSSESIVHIFRTLCPSHIDCTPLHALFFDLQKEYLAHEKRWQHTTLSNYIMGVKWLREARSWRGMWQRYFLDQGLIETVGEFLLPAEVVGEQTKDRFIPFTESNFPTLLSTFHRSMSACERKYGDSMKAVHKVILRPGERLGRQLYLFCAMVTDLQAGQHCIVATKRELRIVRAVALMAAEFVGLTVVDIRLFDVAASVLSSLSSFDLGFIPTEAKFDLKSIITRALEGQKSVCLVTVDDQSDLTSPVFNSFMDIIIDILLAKEVKSLGKNRKVGEVPGLYPDQVTQVMRERVRDNITLCLLVQTDYFSFSRAQRRGPLETLKHDYRSLFNICRLLSFDSVPLTPLLLELAARVKRPIDPSLEHMQKLGESLPIAIDDFTVERIAYIAKVMQKAEEARIRKELDRLRKALGWCVAIELEGEKTPYLFELQAKIEALRKKLQGVRKEKREDSKATPGAEHSIIAERKAFMDMFEKKKERLKKALSDFSKSEWPPTGPLSPSQYILIAMLQRIVDSDSPPFPFDREEEYEEYCRPFLQQTADKGKDISYQLTTVDYARLPDASEYISRVADSDRFSVLGVVVMALEEMRIVAEELSSRNMRRRSVLPGGPPVDEVPHPEMYELQTQMAALEEEMQQVMVLKPKMARLCSDIQGLHREWAAREAYLSSRFDHALGSSLVAATLFVLGLSLASAPRDTVRSSVHSFLQSESISFDPPEPKETRHPTSSPFLQEGISACIWIWRLTLPFPLFVDPYCMAPDLILDRGKIVYTVTAEWSFEEALFDCLPEGRALLVVEPSEHIWQLLLPLAKWRYDRSIEAARGEAIKTTPVCIHNRSVQVHSDFRLYISLPQAPTNPNLSQLFTVISFEPRDEGSWKTSIFLQMEDESQSKEGQIYWRGPKEEILANLADAPPGTIYKIPTLAAIIKSAMRIEPYEAEMAMRGSGKEEVEDPSKSIYVELLSSAVEFSDLLQDLSLDGWTVSCQMYRRLMIQACEEQFQEAGMPTREQLSLVTEPIWYRFFVRLLWGLPRRQQLAVLLLHCISKKFPKEEAAKTRELVIKGLEMPPCDTEESMGKRLKELMEILPSFPIYFTERSMEFKHFVHRFFYMEKENEGTDMRLQLLLISWLRADLFPQFLETLVAESLGRRFTDLPDVDFALVHKLVPAANPFALFCKHVDPLPDMRQVATSLEIGVVSVTPVMKVKTAGLRSESKLKKALKVIATASRDKRWVILEGYEDLEKPEVDTLYKAFYAALSSEYVHPEFRLWVLFQRSPKHLPHWSSFIQQSFRLCINPPTTVREFVTLTQRQLDPALAAASAAKAREAYIERCQISTQFARKGVKKVTRVNPAIRGNLSRILKGDGESSNPRLLLKATSLLIKDQLPQVEASTWVGNPADCIKYNLALGTGALLLRRKFAEDVPFEISWKDVRRNIEDAVALYSASSDPQPTADVFPLLRFYLSLFSTSWRESGYYAAISLFSDVLTTSEKSLLFAPLDGSGDSCDVEYPLYQITGGRGIDQLLQALPKRDLLQFAGLPHDRKRRYDYTRYCRLAAAITHPSPPLTLHFSNLQSMLERLIESLPALQPAERPSNTFESAYDVPIESRTKRFSYYFVPDRFRANDIKSKVLATPPKLSNVLDRLQRANETRYDEFIREIEHSYTRVMGYLTYRTAQLSSRDSAIITSISMDETPSEWRHRGPYLLRKQRNVMRFLSALSRPIADFQGVISLRQVFDPAGLIIALLRNIAFVMQQDYEKMGFELAEHDGVARENSVLLGDLHIFNAVLRSDMLRDNYNSPPSALPVLRCTAILEPSLSDYFPCPPSTLLYYRSPTREISDISRESDISQLAESAFRYSRSEGSVESSSKPLLNKVVLPLFDLKEVNFWVGFLSDRPQSHWSKRDVRLDVA